MSNPIWRDVPPPTKNANGTYTAHWNSVALFFNLPIADQPADYKETLEIDARSWLDDGDGLSKRLLASLNLQRITGHTYRTAASRLASTVPAVLRARR